jgi:hypothetical protein
MKASLIIAALLLPILLLAGDNPGATVNRRRTPGGLCGDLLGFARGPGDDF